MPHADGQGDLNSKGAEGYELSLALALSWAAGLAVYERDPAEVDRFASELIEISTRHNFVWWLAQAESYRGWARSASGDTAEGISWIEQSKSSTLVWRRQ